MGHITLIGLDPDRCAARNRIAAKRGFEAVPLKFLRAPAPVGAGVTSAVGSLPANDAEALDRINAMLDNGNEPLTLDDIYIHYAEAANSNFIPDRYAFMSRRTLKNIATDAAAGFAFMNSHRTGGLSSPAELPYGRTFAGRYENMAATDSEPAGERAVIGFYMLKGVYPNGEGGPSTDAMSAGIKAGTIFDVSVGLYGGTALCDVCEAPFEIDYWGDTECGHYPGTDENMTEYQKQAQTARGVKNGYCSYTMDDCHCGETSAVFDGAVPGAGFRMVLAGQKTGRLSNAGFAQAQMSFAPLFSKGDLMDSQGIAQAVSDGLTSVLTAFGLKPRRGESRRDANAQKHAGNLSAETEEGTLEGKKAEDAAEETDKSDETEDTKPAEETEPEHPVLTAALAAGIDTPDKFAALRVQAEAGSVFLKAERDRAKSLAVVAFGSETEQARQAVTEAHSLIDSSPIGTVQALAGQYKRVAVHLGLASEDGTKKERKSSAQDLPKHATDVVASTAPGEKKLVLEPAGAVFERRKRELAGKS